MIFKKIAGLKGILYRKLKEGEKTGIDELPGFIIKKPSRFAEIPEFEDITKVNFTYPLIEPFAYANIKWDKDNKELIYNLIEPTIDKNEKEMLEKISEGLIEIIDVSIDIIKNHGNLINYIEKNVSKVIKEYGIKVTPSQYIKIMYYVYRNFVGLNEIEALMQDPNIEDISCDGVATPIYVIHRKFGSIKTNIIYNDIEKLRDFIVKLAEKCGRFVSYAEPILSGTLPDGSRVSATFAGDVATRGPVFSIRKFGEKPFSPIEQIEMNTASPEILAYLWFLIENGANILIIGGTATGKTSFLNSLCMFIPLEAKIVSIEDTREIRIPHEHWVPGLARVGFGIPTPTGEKYGGISLFDLLKESFRQNPDYVIVGETRGAETYVMFQGMSSGHKCMSTFHAGSLETMIKRLTTPPIDLSPSLIESLDVVILMIHAKEKGKSARRIKEIVEIISVNPKTDEVETKTIFTWNPATDEYEKVNKSVKVGRLILSKGGIEEEGFAEIDRMKSVLEWLRKNGIKAYLEVIKYINLYHKEQEKIMEMIGEKTVKIEAKESKEIRKEKRVSLLSLLGSMLLREKNVI
ncbi:MAG: type II/IV secretion system ATPase subunit [Candidatus Aenigmatarchaeota archaeon]